MAKNGKPTIVLGMIAIVGVIIILISITGNQKKDPSPTKEVNQGAESNKSERPLPSSDDCALVDELKRTGLITEMNSNEIQVDGSLWNLRTSYNGKKSIVFMLHVCYRPEFVLRDNRTGRILAKYSEYEGIVIE